MHGENFTEIYEIPRSGAARELCVDFAAAKNTVATAVLEFSTYY